VLILYKDPHVDQAYHREELLNSKIEAFTNKTAGNPPIPDSYHLASQFKTLSLDPDAEVKPSARVASGSGSDELAKLVQTFPQELDFLPEVEQQPVLLNLLPMEVILAVLLKLDITSLERFGRTCRKARVLTLDPIYWRFVWDIILSLVIG